MAWSTTYLFIQIFAGVLGGVAVACVGATKDFRLGGLFTHSIVGAIGGGLSGYFLQTLAATMVNANGDANEPSFVNQLVIQSVAGAVAGGVAVLVVGFVKHSIDSNKARQN